MSDQRVLVVDDEPQIVRGLKVILRDAGYEVETAEDKGTAMAAIAARAPDAIVLDLVLPDGSGVDVCREVRSWSSSLPILVLSAVGDEREKVRALDAGADDYVTKPFGPEELLARLRAVLRRGNGEGNTKLTLGELEVDLAAHAVRRNGEDVHLTPIEFNLLRVLATHAGKLVTQRQLLHEVWGPGYESETHYLRVHIAHIRAKLEADPSQPRFLVTEPGVGYRLRAP